MFSKKNSPEIWTVFFRCFIIDIERNVKEK